MSPKVDSRASEPAQSAWSRDVRPNASGVTYSRRSYFYDREFSDSIVRPTDNGTQWSRPHENGWHESTNERRLRSTQLRSADERFGGIQVRGSAGRFVDPFTRGRVLQSAGKDGHDDVYELQGYTPVVVQAAAATPADSEPRTATARLDVQTIAQGIVFAADIFVRMTETYQRIRDIERNGEGSEDEGVDELLGLDVDPYHLEAGPPRRPRPGSRAPPRRARRTFSARKTTSRRTLIATASTAMTVTSEGAQGHTSGSSNATSTRTRSLLPLLPASKRVCYYLIATVIFGIAASFGVAVWWAQSQGDASAGFTIGGYIISVDALVVAIVGVVHRPECRCWKV
ncbi:hypothetical protein E0Z10_g1639 [Xylaria hypoxylon]|uniref:Uncharacterized protein n=1 Tax=Xylaria hypoxylon TaxID=37992 RepID=A0A4Z0Z666_9PEZI|nr:hypothetical protein E0Z10_g1639 [Xylaria hypoxylon]